MLSMEELPSVQIMPNLPFSMGIFGASQTGKTTFLMKLLMSWSDMFPKDQDHIRRIVIIQKFRNQPAYDKLLKHFGSEIVSFATELDENTTSIENLGPTNAGQAILVLDDMLQSVAHTEVLCSLVIGGVHHKNITTFLIGHNLYASRSPEWLTTARNLTMLCIMPNPRDMSLLSSLNRQLFPGRGKKNFVAQAFKMASQDNLRYNKSTYPFLIVDCSTQCDDRYRLRTGIGNDSKFCYVID